MGYEKLSKLYYKNYNIEEELNIRKNNPCTHNTKLFIYPITKGRRDSKTYLELFFLPINEISLLQEKIYTNSKEIENLSQELPNIGKSSCIREIMINEIIKTNNVEGINTTKKDVYQSIQSKKSDKLNGIIKKYEQIISNNIESITTIEEVRKIYDDIFEEEILKNSENKLDGEIFRKEGTHISNGIKTIHTGDTSEEMIIKHMTNLVKYMNDKNVPSLVKACITHYYLEYIHPFYDGNGRLGRLLFSMYLVRKLDIFTGLSLSYGISLEKEKYYKLFLETSESKNYGETTFFVKGMLEIIAKGQESIINMLMKNIFKLNQGRDYLNNSDLSEVEKNILYIYIQEYIFAKEYSFLTDKELLEYISPTKSYNTLKKYLDDLEVKGYIEKTSKKPSQHKLSEKVKEIFD